VSVGNVSSGASVPNTLWSTGGWHEVYPRQHGFDNIASNTFEFDLVAGVDYPKNAKRLNVVMTVTTLETTGTVSLGSVNVDIEDTTNNSTVTNRSDLQIQSIARSPGKHTVGFGLEIPLPSNERGGDGGTPPVVQVRVDVSGLGTLDIAIMETTAWMLR